jgi:WhiB family redox-sensing transcriptional regulator
VRSLGHIAPCDGWTEGPRLGEHPAVPSLTVRIDRPQYQREQAPTLSEFEEARAYAQTARRVALESLMASEDMPDVGALLAELISRPAWHVRAACRGEDVSTFILERGQSDKAAQRVCAACPVRSECHGYAMDDPELVGVWGGTSGRQRRLMRRGSVAWTQIVTRRWRVVPSRCPVTASTPATHFDFSTDYRARGQASPPYSSLFSTCPLSITRPCAAR